MEDNLNDFLAQKRFAVVGSFRNQDKIAFKILHDLRQKGYETFPVNPVTKGFGGMPCYKNIASIPYPIDVAVLVTPPRATEEIVKECLQKGIKRIWLQPGAESSAAVQFCQDHDMAVIHSTCIMIKTTQQKERL